MVLSAALFAWLDLASPASRFAGCAPLPGDVIPLQALESSLALAHSPRAHCDCLAATRGMDPPPPCAISQTTGRTDARFDGRTRNRCDRWRVAIDGEPPVVAAVRISTDFTFVSYPSLPAEFYFATTNARRIWHLLVSRRRRKALAVDSHEQVGFSRQDRKALGCTERCTHLATAPTATWPTEKWPDLI